MNKKEAKDWLYNPERRKDLRVQYNQADLATVYLEAIDKASILEDCLRKLVDENGDIETVKLTLKEWEAMK